MLFSRTVISSLFFLVSSSKAGSILFDVEEKPKTEPSIFRVIKPAEDENLATFEPSFGLFNFSDPSTGVIGTRSIFSGNVYDRRTTPIKLEESGQGFQPVVIPVPLDGVIGTFSSISLVTRGLPAQDFDPDNPSTKITIKQISYTAYLCVNEIAADPLGPVLGCLLLQYGGPFFNDPLDAATFPTSIDAVSCCDYFTVMVISFSFFVSNTHIMTMCTFIRFSFMFCFAYCRMFLVVQECLKVQVERLLTLIVPIQVVLLYLI